MAIDLSVTLRGPASISKLVDSALPALGQSEIPYGGIHTLLGALPALLHPRPEEVAVIGLGSGDTLFALGGRRETRHIACVEVVRPQLRNLEMYSHGPQHRSVPQDEYMGDAGWLRPEGRAG
jgi:hypothetical protein